MLVFPCSQPQRLNALEDADNLIRHIFDPQRSRALLVVTTRGNHASPDIDVDNVNLSTNGCIDIVLLDDDEISHRFSEMLEASGHKSLATYRGAARLYMPCPPAQDDDRSWAPLFYTDTAPHRHALVAHLVALSSNGTRIAAPCNGHDSRHTSLLSPPPTTLRPINSSVSAPPPKHIVSRCSCFPVNVAYLSSLSRRLVMPNPSSIWTI